MKHHYVRKTVRNVTLSQYVRTCKLHFIDCHNCPLYTFCNQFSNGLLDDINLNEHVTLKFPVITRKNND